jgi:Skp family chaperone for outer membrane proteins
MNIQNDIKMGVAALALALGIAGLVGFRQSTNKIGVVDMASVFDSADYTARENAKLADARELRRSVLEFLDTYRTANADQAQKIHDLSLKKPRTADEEALLTKTKADVLATDKQATDLQIKPNPTADDTAKLKAFSDAAQATRALTSKWAQDFDEELGNMRSKLHDDGIRKLKEAVKTVGAKQGFSVIFAKDRAPYGANNVTADVLKALNAQKD